MNCKMAACQIHAYLDGDISREQAQSLRQHLSQCKACSSSFDELSKLESLCRSLPVPQTTPELTTRMMSILPKSGSRTAWMGWIRRHPGLSAAALFLVIMLSSFTALWNQNQQLTVSGPNLDVLEYDGSIVIVPEGKEIAGDLTVSKGSVRVLGSVQGNLTVIDGHVTLASTAHIAGHVEKVDRALDWAWYKLKSWFGVLAHGA